MTKKLRIPSLQHLSRLIFPTAEMTCDNLVKLALNPPRFSYQPVYKSIEEMLILGTPVSQVLKGMERISNPSVKKNFQELIPLIGKHFSALEPDYVLPMQATTLFVRPGLIIPFNPQLVYGRNGEKVFPYFSLWRSNPLHGERLSFFVTMVEDMLLKDPDLEDAKFEIIDLSCPYKKKARDVVVKDAATVSRMEKSKVSSILEIFWQGLVRAQEILDNMPIVPKPEKAKEERDPRQASFLDDEEE